MGTVAGGLAIAGTAASVLGTGVSVFGAVQQGAAQKSAADYQAQVAKNNATVAAQNAAAVQDQAAAKAQSDQRAGALRLGAQRAALGASGVTLDSGSSEAVQSATVNNTALSTQLDTYQGQLAAYGYQTQGVNYNAQAQLDTLTGQNAASAGDISAVGNFLGGASQVSSRWAM